MKTNVNKTSTGLKIPALPKPATGTDRIIAGLIDLAILYVGHKTVLQSFDLGPALAHYHPELPRVVAILFLYFVFTIIPHAFLSQTIGKFIMRIKLVREENYARLGLFTVIFRDLFVRPLVLVLPFVLLNKEGRAFHDKSAGSMAVKAK